MAASNDAGTVFVRGGGRRGGEGRGWIMYAGWFSEAHPQRWCRGLKHPQRWGGDGERRDYESRCRVRENGSRCMDRDWSGCKVGDSAKIGENGG